MNRAAAEVAPPVPSAVLGMILLLVTEVMFFGGLISAYLVSRAGAAAWPPAGQPRLPVAATAVNTVVLLLSAVALGLARRSARRADGGRSAWRWLGAAAGLGAAFLGLQGMEWARLLRFGLTADSSVYGGFFYLIVGAHGAHVLAGLGLLAWLLRVPPAPGRAAAATLYWFFVVTLWPVLYILVYLL
jgi:heme/copper-type cytochrome/quinol oxidase subunit 3